MTSNPNGPRFQGVAVVGDRIRHYLCAEHGGCYREGVVVAAYPIGVGFHAPHLVIRITADVWDGSEPGGIGKIGLDEMVYMDQGCCDWAGRVVKV